MVVFGVLVVRAHWILVECGDLRSHVKSVGVSQVVILFAVVRLSPSSLNPATLTTNGILSSTED